MNTVKRSIIDIITARLQQEQIVALTGARQTGKTTLCEELRPEFLNLPFTYISFDDPDERLRFQRSTVSILENIKTPLVVLDEVQKIPQLFDPLKLVVDRERSKPIAERKRFVLTGSSQLLMMKGIRESLAGRVALCQMHPFSLHELTCSGCSPAPLPDMERTPCNGSGCGAPAIGLAATVAHPAGGAGRASALGRLSTGMAAHRRYGAAQLAQRLS